MSQRTFLMYVSYSNVIAPLERDPESAESKSIMELIEQRAILLYGESAMYFEVDYPLDQGMATSFCEIYDDVFDDIQVIKIHTECQHELLD